MQNRTASEHGLGYHEAVFPYVDIVRYMAQVVYFYITLYNRIGKRSSCNTYICTYFHSFGLSPVMNGPYCKALRITLRDFRIIKHELAVFNANNYIVPYSDFARKYFLRKCVLYFAGYCAAERTSSIAWIKAYLCHVLRYGLVKTQPYIARLKPF